MVDRSAYEKFKYERIVDGWTDIPEFAQNKKQNLYAEAITKESGNHLRNLRLNNGLHLHMDIGKDGVWMHKDYFDPNKSPVHAITHGAIEVAPESTTKKYLRWLERKSSEIDDTLDR